MRRRVPAFALAGMVAVMVAGIGASPAAAHEGRRVGNFEFTVGWGTEPAYAGYENSVQLRLHEVERTSGPHSHGSAADHAVTDLKDTLKVEVSFGDQKQTYTMQPRFVVGVFGEPGDYRAYLIPTRPGTYSFRFFGTIRGQQVDTRFTSGPGTFDSVRNTTEAQFPEKDPSTGELSTKLERETARLVAAAKAADDAAANARLLAYGGIGLGVIALVVALLRGRRRTA